MNSFNTSAVLDESTIKGTSESAAAADAVEDAIGPADIGDPETSEAAVWSRFGDGPLPALPKMAAVGRAYRAAMEFGLPEGFASALSHGVVDPAALRIALNSPTRINVAGGVIEVIDIDLYTPGLVPLPTNNRTMDMRVYPAGGVTGHLGPLTGPRSEPGKTSGLWIEAQSVQHALDEAKQAQDYVLVKNPLKDSVAARGIVMPVTVVYFELRHRDGQPAMPLLGTADGSSRITGAHAVLNLVDPRVTHYDLPGQPRLVPPVRGQHLRAGHHLPWYGRSAEAPLAAQRADHTRADLLALHAPARRGLRLRPGRGGLRRHASCRPATAVDADRQAGGDGRSRPGGLALGQRAR